MKPEKLSALLLKYKDVPARDFVLAKIASKLDALEIILMEKLYPEAAKRESACEQLDADSLVMLESYLNLLRAGQVGGDAHVQSSLNN